MLALAARGQVPGRDPYEILIEPGSTPRLTAEAVVPKALPEPFGSIGLSGTIESIERVACFRGRRLAEVDPCLSAGDEDTLVWVVLFRGRLVFHRWEAPLFRFDRGYYLVDDRSGQRFGGGTCPAAPSPALDAPHG